MNTGPDKFERVCDDFLDDLYRYVQLVDVEYQAKRVDNIHGLIIRVKSLFDILSDNQRRSQR